MSQRKIQYWVIPPQANSEFVASMEEVLETYAQPYDGCFPVLCMDEQPVQLLKETRVPVAATKRHPRRVDYEYERAGTASIFVPRVVHMVHPLVHGGIFCISFHFNNLKQYRGSGGPKPRGCAPLEPFTVALWLLPPAPATPPAN